MHSATVVGSQESWCVKHQPLIHVRDVFVQSALECKTCADRTLLIVVAIASTVLVYGVGVVLGQKSSDNEVEEPVGEVRPLCPCRCAITALASHHPWHCHKCCSSCTGAWRLLCVFYCWYQFTDQWRVQGITPSRCVKIQQKDNHSRDLDIVSSSFKQLMVTHPMKLLLVSMTSQHLC